MDKAVLTHDLSLDALAGHMDLSRRAVQVLTLMAQYGELSTADMAMLLNVSMKTLRTRHLPKLVDLHWLRAERLVQSGPGTETWRMDTVRRKRVEVLFRHAERSVLDRLTKVRGLPAARLSQRPVSLGSME